VIPITSPVASGSPPGCERGKRRSGSTRAQRVRNRRVSCAECRKDSAQQSDDTGERYTRGNFDEADVERVDKLRVVTKHVTDCADRKSIERGVDDHYAEERAHRSEQQSLFRPSSSPKRMNAVVIDAKINSVRAGLRHRPDQMSGKYFKPSWVA
jgi:hypothetical protein